MKIEAREGYGITLKEVFEGVRLETKEGENVSICMRDGGFEMAVWFAGDTEGQGGKYSIRRGEINIL